MDPRLSSWTKCEIGTNPSSEVVLSYSVQSDTSTSETYVFFSHLSFNPSHVPPQLLSRAQIFLNPSLTEAFGIGILEAACAGLFVVSTRVGGVPEVLPPGLVEFAEPEVQGSSLPPSCRPCTDEDAIDLVEAISRAIKHVRAGGHDPIRAHEELKGMYSWTDVAARTETVYRGAMKVPEVPIIERLRR